MRIKAHTRYHDGHFIVNDQQLADGTGSADECLSNAWNAVGVDHPRFHRADRLSRLVLLCTEPFFVPLMDERMKDGTAMVIMGRHGSLDTDERYYDQLRDEGLASPGLFVYTLANIAMGELSIRHGLHGPGLCLLNEEPDVDQLRSACAHMLATPGVQRVVCGWADIFAGRAQGSFLLLGNEGDQWTPARWKTHFDEHH